jgi:hypothetical protein
MATEKPSPVEQGTHFWFMTIQTSNASGYFICGYQGTWTPRPEVTRLDTFNDIREFVDQRDSRANGGVVTAFDIQPNKP